MEVGRITQLTTNSQFEQTIQNKIYERGVMKLNNEGQEPVRTFGDAIEVLKKGKKVARSGWNGKGMYLFLIGMKGDYWTYTNGKNDNYPLLPFIAMKTADNMVVPWLASQTDMLSEDWAEVE